MEFPLYYFQRFFPFKLNELIQTDNYVIQKFVKSRNFQEIARDIILLIRYPLFEGKPDDQHCYKAFRSLGFKWQRNIRYDYWQTAQETLHIEVGDCEDSSAAFVTAMRAKGAAENEVYEVLGYVTDEEGSILGGHGWSVSKHIPDGKFRLYESTLDTPPAEYPAVPDIKKPFKLNKWTYVPEQLFNDKEYIWVKEIEPPFTTSMKSKIKLHKALEEAWGIEDKLLKAIRSSLVGRLRYGRRISSF